ncbi:hypothetical protein [Micromonospora haikouensis]|uniref:hypothetical protein n=1 Tax=Micromonospora haikouensis TaxID=686309 RepID=UPI001187557E|nr:hypothetical protein [Micromonospora haikouensis]
MPEPAPNVWEIINSLGAFFAAVIALVAILVTIKVTRDQAKRQRQADEEATADKRRLYEIGILRELLDSIPSSDHDQQSMKQNGNAEVVTHQQFTLLSLLPNDVLPLSRQIAIIIGRGRPFPELLEVLNEANVPQAFSPAQRVRRLQTREVLEEIRKRTGGEPSEVEAWLDRLDGRAS